MRIAQIVVNDASEFERKLQRVDAAALAGRHEPFLASSPVDADAADLAHVYAGAGVSERALAGLRVPYVSSAELTRGILPFRRIPPPRYVLSPIASVDSPPPLQRVPEAVEQEWFASRASNREIGPGPVVASFRGRRPGVANAIEQAFSRVLRFRDDVTWNVLDHAPSPLDLIGVDVWVDPATVESDFDGFTAEAIAAGKRVVATRTRINDQRLEKGRTGFLVPCNDPNELTHAILAALFKPEVARLKIEAARQTAAKFRPSERVRLLERIYETLIE